MTGCDQELGVKTNPPFLPLVALDRFLSPGTDGAKSERDTYGTKDSVDESVTAHYAHLSLAGSCWPLVPPLLSCRFREVSIASR